MGWGDKVVCGWPGRLRLDVACKRGISGQREPRVRWIESWDLEDEMGLDGFGWEVGKLFQSKGCVGLGSSLKDPCLQGCRSPYLYRPRAVVPLYVLVCSTIVNNVVAGTYFPSSDEWR